MEKTLFTQIINGEIPCFKVYEDAETFAFLDINPINPGHTLVVPKTQVADALTAPEADWLAVMKTTHHLAPLIKKATEADGLNILTNSGTASGQEVFHLHVHIIPRYENDQRASRWQHSSYPPGEAEAVLKKILAV